MLSKSSWKITPVRAGELLEIDDAIELELIATEDELDVVAELLDLDEELELRIELAIELELRVTELLDLLELDTTTAVLLAAALDGDTDDIELLLATVLDCAADDAELVATQVLIYAAMS